jgi:hypothetical protein
MKTAVILLFFVFIIFPLSAGDAPSIDWEKIREIPEMHGSLTITDGDGNLKGEAIYVYGKITGAVEYTNNGQNATFIENVYDAFGKRTETYQYFNKIPEFKILYKYSGDILIETELQRPAGDEFVKDSTSKYEYDENGNAVKITTTFNDPDIILETFSFDSSGKIKTRKFYYNDRLEETINFKYDEFGNVVKRDSESDYLTSVYDIEYEYKYDDRGRIVEEKRYYDNKPDVPSYHFIYTYQDKY